MKLQRLAAISTYQPPPSHPHSHTHTHKSTPPFCLSYIC